MTRMASLSQLENAKLRASLFPLGVDTTVQLLETLGREVPQGEREPETLTALVVSEVESGRASLDAVLRLTEYFKLAPKVENKSSGLTKVALAELLGMRTGSSERTTREELIKDLRRRILDGTVSPAGLVTQDELFIRNRINKIKKPGIRGYIATRLLGTNVEDYAPADLTQLLLDRIRGGQLTEDEMDQLIKKAQSEAQLARRRKVEGVTNIELAQRIDRLAADVREVRAMVRRLDEQRVQGFAREFRPESGRDIVGLLREARVALAKGGGKPEDKYDHLLSELMRDGRSLSTLVERVELMTLLDRLEQMVHALTLSIPPEDFIRILKDEVAAMHVATSPPIFKVRDAVLKRLGLSPEEWTRQLLECRTRGWVRLIEGAPYSESEDHWLDMDGRRYYYLEVVGGD